MIRHICTDLGIAIFGTFCFMIGLIIGEYRLNKYQNKTIKKLDNTIKKYEED